MVNVICTCPICGAENVVVCENEQYEAWKKGALVQNAFPKMDPDSRELLITGICRQCYDKMIDAELD